MSPAERLAREKAWAIAKQRPNDAVLGADTVVVIDDQILGKPADSDEAARMLRTLSGRTVFSPAWEEFRSRVEDFMKIV